MEMYQQDRYWKFRNTRGPVPEPLRGEWVSKAKAEDALEAFQSLVRSRAVNVTQRARERRERADSYTTASP